MSRAFAILVALTALSCGGVPSIIGLTEPIRIPSATFHAGSVRTRDDADTPAITSAEVSIGYWWQGQLGSPLSGRASDDTYAIAFRFDDLGTGCWVIPVGGLDPTYPGERDWDITFDLGGGVPTGTHVLRIYALDEDGIATSSRELSMCVVDRRVPNNFNVCEPTRPPPDTVIALEWDQPVDLDLVVVTPEGKRVDARHPTTILPAPNTSITPAMLADPGVGKLDGDSNAECVVDGRNSESLTWIGTPNVAGDYQIYADLYDACHMGSVHYVVTVYRSLIGDDGDAHQVQVDQRSGFLVQQASSGGAGAPQYVFSVSLP